MGHQWRWWHTSPDQRICVGHCEWQWTAAEAAKDFPRTGQLRRCLVGRRKSLLTGGPGLVVRLVDRLVAEPHRPVCRNRLSASGRVAVDVATRPGCWRPCCLLCVVSRRGRGVVRSRPSGNGSWSYEHVGGRSPPPAGRSASRGRRRRTGPAGAGSIDGARSWVSSARWIPSTSGRSTLATCPKTSAS